MPALGQTLDESWNDITMVTTFAIGPALSCVAVKVPYFAYERFKGQGSSFHTDALRVRDNGIWDKFWECAGKGVAFYEDRRAKTGVAVLR